LIDAKAFFDYDQRENGQTLLDLMIIDKMRIRKMIFLKAIYLKAKFIV